MEPDPDGQRPQAARQVGWPRVEHCPTEIEDGGWAPRKAANRGPGWTFKAAKHPSSIPEWGWHPACLRCAQSMPGALSLSQGQALRPQARLPPLLSFRRPPARRLPLFLPHHHHPFLLLLVWSPICHLVCRLSQPARRRLTLASLALRRFQSSSTSCPFRSAFPGSDEPAPRRDKPTNCNCTLLSASPSPSCSSTALLPRQRPPTGLRPSPHHHPVASSIRPGHLNTDPCPATCRITPIPLHDRLTGPHGGLGTRRVRHVHGSA